MDAIIIWGVIWLVIAGTAIPLSVAVLVGLGFLVADEDGAAVGGVSGWIVGIVLGAFALIQVVLHVAHLIQFIVAGAGA